MNEFGCTVKALLSPGVGLFTFWGLREELIERGLIRRGLIPNSRQKFYSKSLLHSLCIPSIEKSVLATTKVYTY